MIEGWADKESGIENRYKLSMINVLHFLI